MQTKDRGSMGYVKHLPLYMVLKEWTEGKILQLFNYVVEHNKHVSLHYSHYIASKSVC